MPEISDVVPGADVLATWGNQIRDRAVMRYATESARDASDPGPEAGQLCYVEDIAQWQAFYGAAWVPAVILVDGDTIQDAAAVERIVFGADRTDLKDAAGVNRVSAVSGGDVYIRDASGAAAVYWDESISAFRIGAYTLVTDGSVNTQWGPPEESVVLPDPGFQEGFRSDLTSSGGNYPGTYGVLVQFAPIASSGRIGQLHFARGGGGRMWYRAIADGGTAWGEWYAFPQALAAEMHAVANRVEAHQAGPMAVASTPAITELLAEPGDPLDDPADARKMPELGALIGHLLDRIEALEAHH